MKKKLSLQEIFHFEYADTFFDSLFTAFKYNGGNSLHERFLRLPSHFGDGNVRFFPVEDGLCLYYHDYSLNNEIRVHRKAISSNQPFYQLHYILNDLTQRVSTKKNMAELEVGGKILFMSNESTLENIYSAGSKVKVVSLLFSPKWLEKNKVLPADQINRHIETLEKNPPFLLNNMNITDHTIASRLHQSIEEEQCTSLKIRANCLLLVHSYFAHLASHDYMSPARSRSSHLPEIERIEAEVCDHLETVLPQLNKLAVQFHMSASTLKRHFKAVYGKNIYQYYLEKKMGLAKNLLQNEGLSIAEVAYTLGYEKAGSLTTAFKKVYGLAPRDIKIG